MVSNLLKVNVPTFWTTWKGTAWTTSCWYILLSIIVNITIHIVLAKAPAGVDRKLGNFLAQAAWCSSRGTLGHALIESFITLLMLSNAKILICSKIPFLEGLEIWSLALYIPGLSRMVSSLESRLCLGRWNTHTPPSTPPRTPPHTSPPSPPG